MRTPLLVSRRLSLAFSTALALCHSACGVGPADPEETTMAPNSTGGAGLDGSGGNGSGGNGEDTLNGGTDDTSTAISKIQVVRLALGAQVSIFSGHTDHEQRSAATKAAFDARGCELTTMAGCTLTVCERDAEPSESNTDTSTLLSMGDITFETANGIEDPLAGTIPFEDGYHSNVLTGDLGGGEQITISTTGADIPAFTTTLPFPLAPIFTFTASTSADANGYATVPVSRGEALALQWDARGSSSQIETIQNSPSGSENAPTVSCQWDAEAGEGVIPQEVMSRLLPGTQLLVMGSNRSVVTTTAGDVSLVFAFPGLNQEKNASPRYELQ